MVDETFHALVLTRHEDKKTQANFEQVNISDLPDGDALVKVQYSSLNYKDGLAVTGAGPIVRKFPMIPGIDFVGTVEETQSSEYQVGDIVILTGWGVGETHWGGYGAYARVPAEWLVPLPDGLSAEDAMAVGTAGFTAMMAVMALVAHDVKPESGAILVTGATGGAGSVAVAILGAMGYNVVASTGRAEEQGDYLKSLGASEIIGRFEAPQRPLQSERWAGAVDSVGGDALAFILSETKYGGSVAALGLAGGSNLNTTVFPFILRGVNLLGIDSVMCPRDYRLKVWEQVTKTLPVEKLALMKQVEPLSKVPELAQQILAGQVRGRVVINI
jgi:acrylyl-CoA reductase (NADPH)